MSAKEKMEKDQKEPGSFKEHLKEISEILEWFDSQEELDVELALGKIKKAAELIKSSKKRLVEIENEFKEIKKEVEE
jgi:exonuclease VII small subunit